MAPDFIDRTIRISWVIGAVLFVFLAPFSPVSVTWGISLGAFLSGLNLWIIQVFLGSLLSESSKRKRISYVCMKFPLYYGMLFLVLYLVPVSLWAFGAGFTLPFILMVLKVAPQLSLGEGSSFLIMNRER